MRIPTIVVGLLCASCVVDAANPDGAPSPGLPPSGVTSDPGQGSTSVGSGGDGAKTSAEGTSGGTETSRDTEGPTSGGSTAVETSEPVGSTGEPDTGRDPTGDPPQLPCCSPQAGGGCADASIEACVCEQDPYCCNFAWDIACVTEVEGFECGSCGTQDEVATCEALCSTFVNCAPELGYANVDDCVQLECLGLLDQAQAESQACVQALAQYNACIGLLDCQGFSDYVNANPPDGFPCMGFQDSMFAACPFATG